MTPTDRPACPHCGGPETAACLHCGGRTCPRCGRCYGCGKYVCVVCGEDAEGGHYADHGKRGKPL